MWVVEKYKWGVFVCKKRRIEVYVRNILITKSRQIINPIKEEDKKGWRRENYRGQEGEKS